MGRQSNRSRKKNSQEVAGTAAVSVASNQTLFDTKDVETAYKPLK